MENLNKAVVTEKSLDELIMELETREELACCGEVVGINVCGVAVG